MGTPRNQNDPEPAETLGLHALRSKNFGLVSGFLYSAASFIGSVGLGLPVGRSNRSTDS
jgi:hypothetical protein